MRKLPGVTVGALVIAMVLAPTTAFASTTPPSPKNSSPPPSDPGPSSSDPGPSPSDPGPSPSNPGSKGPVGSTDPAKGPNQNTTLGTFDASPLTGKPGTVITVKSVTPCLDSNGKVTKSGALGLLNPAKKDSQGDPVVVETKVLDLSASGAWSATLTVPTTVASGTDLMIAAGCFSAIPTEITEADVVLLYTPQDFMVSAAPTAPVAQPVTKNPSFTG